MAGSVSQAIASSGAQSDQQGWRVSTIRDTSVKPHQREDITVGVKLDPLLEWFRNAHSGGSSGGARIRSASTPSHTDSDLHRNRQTRQTRERNPTEPAASADTIATTTNICSPQTGTSVVRHGQNRFQVHQNDASVTSMLGTGEHASNHRVTVARSHRRKSDPSTGTGGGPCPARQVPARRSSSTPSYVDPMPFPGQLPQLLEGASERDTVAGEIAVMCPARLPSERQPRAAGNTVDIQKFQGVAIQHQSSFSLRMSSGSSRQSHQLPAGGAGSGGDRWDSFALDIRTKGLPAGHSLVTGVTRAPEYKAIAADGGRHCSTSPVVVVTAAGIPFPTAPNAPSGSVATVVVDSEAQAPKCETVYRSEVDQEISDSPKVCGHVAPNSLKILDAPDDGLGCLTSIDVGAQIRSPQDTESSGQVTDTFSSLPGIIRPIIRESTDGPRRLTGVVTGRQASDRNWVTQGQVLVYEPSVPTTLEEQQSKHPLNQLQPRRPSQMELFIDRLPALIAAQNCTPAQCPVALGSQPSPRDTSNDDKADSSSPRTRTASNSEAKLKRTSSTLASSTTFARRSDHSAPLSAATVSRIELRVQAASDGNQDTPRLHTTDPMQMPSVRLGGLLKTSASQPTFAAWTSSRHVQQFFIHQLQAAGGTAKGSLAHPTRRRTGSGAETNDTKPQQQAMSSIHSKPQHRASDVDFLKALWWPRFLDSTYFDVFRHLQHLSGQPMKLSDLSCGTMIAKGGFGTVFGTWAVRGCRQVRRPERWVLDGIIVRRYSSRLATREPQSDPQGVKLLSTQSTAYDRLVTWHTFDTV